MAAAAAWGKLPSSCTVCRRPEAKEDRARWGCDGPTDMPAFDYDCVRCFGTDPECTRCAGSGIEQATRCAFAVRTAISCRIIEYVGLVEAGFLPVEGGWEDQSATFAHAVRFAAGQRAKILARKAPETGH